MRQARRASRPRGRHSVEPNTLDLLGVLEGDFASEGSLMDSETLDRLCEEAMQRIVYFINRACSQNLRRMRESWGKQ